MKNTFYNDFDVTPLESPGPRDPDPRDHRTIFQIDRDRIIFSHAFRRLQSKTQVFQSGDYDFYRTRLTHSIEVARIGRSICEYLRQKCTSVLPQGGYIDPDLLEAVGISHDLGHPPFGHIGERKLNEIMTPYGGFEGNAQTLRIITENIYTRRDAPRGMRPTRAFLDGILKYKKLYSEAFVAGKPPENHFIYDSQADQRQFALGEQQIPLQIASNLNAVKSIECQIMDWADDTAYSLHDIVDGIKAGFLTPQRIEQWAEGKAIDPIESQLLDSLIDNIGRDRVEAIFSIKVGDFIRACSLKKADHPLGAQSARYAYQLRVSPEVEKESKLYKKIALDLIFRSPQLQQIEFKGGYILEKLWQSLKQNYLSDEPRPLKLLPENVNRWVENETTEAARARRICDYLADLTDKEAIRLYKKLYEPEFGSITDLT